MAAGDQAPPVLARRAPKADQIVITAGGARRKRAVGGIPVVAAEGEDGEEMAPLGARPSAGWQPALWRKPPCPNLPAEAQR